MTALLFFSGLELNYILYYTDSKLKILVKCPFMDSNANLVTETNVYQLVKFVMINKN